MSVVINGTGSISGLSNVGGIASAQSGSVIQTVTATSTSNILATSSTSFVNSTLSVSITPQFSNSKILLFYSGVAWPSTNASANNAVGTLIRNSTNIGGSYGCFVVSTVNNDVSTCITLLDSPATTSATTYYFGGKTSNASYTAYFGDSNVLSTLTALEIAA